MSLRELARRAEVSTAHLSEIERERCGASADVLERIAKALDVPICVIREGTQVSEQDEELQLFKKEKAADLLGVSVSWVKKAAAAREIPCTYIGKGQRKLLRFSAEHIRKIRADGEVVPGTYGRTPA